MDSPAAFRQENKPVHMFSVITLGFSENSTQMCCRKTRHRRLERNGWVGCQARCSINVDAVQVVALIAEVDRGDDRMRGYDPFCTFSLNASRFNEKNLYMDKHGSDRNFKALS